MTIDKTVIASRHEGELSSISIKKLSDNLSFIYQRENLALGVRTVTGNTTLIPRDSFIIADTSSTPITVTLAYANSWKGRSTTVTIRNSGLTNNVTIAVQGADTLLGYVTVVPQDIIEIKSDGVSVWSVITSAAGLGYNHIPSVFDYMSPAEVSAVRARTFAVDVTVALNNAFNAGVGYMPPGGYACSSSIAISISTTPLHIWGDGSEQTEIRFTSLNFGLVIDYTDAVTPPSVGGLTMTTSQHAPGWQFWDHGGPPAVWATLNVYSVGDVVYTGTPATWYQCAIAHTGGVFATDLAAGKWVGATLTGLSIKAAASPGYHWRRGPTVFDVVFRGVDSSRYAWATDLYLQNNWYPCIRDCTFKGFSNNGEVLNTFECLHAIYLDNVMSPFFSNFNVYHTNTGIYETSPTKGEGVVFSNFEMVGVRVGFDLGNNASIAIKPGSFIGPGHVNASYRGIQDRNRGQAVIFDLNLYRLGTGTTLAWRGIDMNTCEIGIITNCIFASIEATDTTQCRGVLLTDCNDFTLSHLTSYGWNAAGYLVELAGNSENNRVDCRTNIAGPGGTAVWTQVLANTTGVNNRIEDPEAGIQLLTANSATPSIGNALSGVFQTQNTGATTITNFTNGYAGQVIQVLVNDVYTTFGNGATLSMRPGQNYLAQAGDVFIFRNYGANVWREVSRNGNVAAFSTGSFTGLLDLSAAGAGQIKFPASQNASADANTLDDYEEGPWTPTITFGSGSTGITYTTQAGSYTKIGNRVFLNGYVLLSNKGSSAGTARIENLPFTVRNNTDSASTAAVNFVNITFAGQYSGYAAVNTTTIVLDNVTEAGTYGTLTDTNFANTSSILFSVNYRVG